MSETLPHHDEQWDDLPLPNENEAWQKMQHLLDEKEKRRRYLPLWFWKYGLAGLVLLAVAAGGYRWVSRNTNKSMSGGRGEETITPKRRGQKATGTDGQISATPLKQNQVVKENKPLPLSTVNETAATSTDAVTKPAPKKAAESNTPVVTTSGHRRPLRPTPDSRARPFQQNDNAPFGGRSRMVGKKAGTTRQRFPVRTPVAEKENVVNGQVDRPTTLGSPVMAESSPKADSTKAVETKISSDSLRKKDSAIPATDTVKAAEVLAVQSGTGKTKKKIRLLFSAGAGLQQAIAFNGQQASHYNLNGRQNRLSDYIPSVYLRLQKGRWFLQGELHYRVPHLVRPFSFSQTTLYNAARADLETERIAIQKLYYHQLPLGLNYRVLPQWSVGAGATVSRLAGAVTAQETEQKNLATGADTTVVRIIPVKGFRDSFLYRSTAGLFLQTDYHWRRFSIGLRYTASLQPFIKYTTPGGAIVQEKSGVLQAVLRFRISGSGL